MFHLFVVASLVTACFALPQPMGFHQLPAPSIPISGRIVGGEEVTIDKVPYQVVFLFSGSYVCGGSIVRADVVVSAAHCMFSSAASVYSFRAGSSFYSSGGQVIGASKAISHQNYSGSYNDISLFVLTEGFTLGPNISVVALPKQGQNIPDNSMATTSGWGAMSEGGAISSIIRKVDIPIVNQKLCNSAYQSLGWEVNDLEICAGEFTTGGKDACQGDSGGPLVVKNQLVGITSWGLGCARVGFPGVWTRVTSFVDWIHSEWIHSDSHIF